LPGIEPDGKLIWTYFEAMKPEKMPKSLLVMGSGAIGIEFASFYRTMGVDVTVVEVMKTVMPVEDAEISAFAKKQFDKQGMKILLEAKVTKVEKGCRFRHRSCRAQGRQDRENHRRPDDFRCRRAGQHREPRP
jgi:dihydrolipoamide dehydrogenase